METQSTNPIDTTLEKNQKNEHKKRCESMRGTKHVGKGILMLKETDGVIPRE